MSPEEALTGAGRPDPEGPDADRVAEAVATLAPAARTASARAHAPYSGFLVGAALRTGEGEVFAACNVESASYGLTQCAERNALGTAIAEGVLPGTIDTLLIYLPGNEPLPPCGACRQVMLELMAPGGLVVSSCDSDRVQAWTVETLLPDAFLGR